MQKNVKFTQNSHAVYLFIALAGGVALRGRIKNVENIEHWWWSSLLFQFSDYKHELRSVNIRWLKSTIIRLCVIVGGVAQWLERRFWLANFPWSTPDLQGGPKKWHTLFLYVLTSSTIDRFSNLLHCQNLENTVAKHPTTAQVCCYTTLRNVSVLKATIETRRLV